MLLQNLDCNSNNRDCVKMTTGATGHAIIQLDKTGGNCIIIQAGANGELTEADVEITLRNFGEGDLIVL